MFSWLRKRGPMVVGTWVLIKADEQPPDSIGILSMRMTIAADGSLSWESQMRGPWEGMTMRGHGTWSKDGNRIIYARKEQFTESVARFEGSRLVFEPDFVLVRDGSTPVVSVYERVQES
jgi:hypothetical protein